MSNAPGPQEFTDSAAQAVAHEKRDDFIASLRERQDDILALAASYHPTGAEGQFFKEPSHGSYNICFFVKFRSDTNGWDRWVVRIPLRPCLAFGARTKLESEIATMELIASRTTIPIPRVIASSIEETSTPLSTFIILEYIEGEILTPTKMQDLSDEHRKNFYVSLADIYIQLRRLEFPSMGCLVRCGDKFEARKMPASIDINMLDLQGLHPLRILNRYYHRNPLTSATSYISMLLDIADDAFVESRHEMEADLVEENLYNLNLFRQFSHDWIDTNLNQGPFVLSHGDLKCFNLIVGPDFKILALLDWEWSKVVPRQLFNPPLWLRGSDITIMAFSSIYGFYLEVFDEILAILRLEERKRYGNTMLADEWNTAKQNGGFLVANALQSRSHIDWVAHRYITPKLHGREGLRQRVRHFMEQDPSFARIVARKSRSFPASCHQTKDVEGKEQLKN